MRVLGARGRSSPSGARSRLPEPSTAKPSPLTARPRLSIGWPSLGRSGYPFLSMRGRPSGFGHEPVVQMCPQKWNASLFSGRTAAATAAPPVAASIAPPMRPRNERRVIPEASRVERALAAPSRNPSGRRMLHPCGAERDEPVELLERVDGPLRGDEPVDDVDEERRSGHAPAL